ncbi:unnamed protein product [Meloidogyne enterolobii]|uniref:Uncharacterized protein n=1 Tax=Meloidogyne enterolobii TaxID=390850 RepID=A0ACB0ZAL3_MELEN
MAFLSISPEMLWYLIGYLAVILNISAAVNAPILYFNRYTILNFKLRGPLYTLYHHKSMISYPLTFNYWKPSPLILSFDPPTHIRLNPVY